MKNILSIIFRRKTEALIFALCIVLMPLSVSYVVTEKYESSASILLTAGRFKKPFLPNEKDSQTGFIQLSMEDVASEVEILLSRPVLEKVVTDNGLDVFPEPKEGETLKWILSGLKKGFNGFLIAIDLKKEMTDFDVAVEKLAGDVEVEFLKRTNIITIEWRGHSPEQAKQVVNSLIKEYIKHHIEVHGYASALKVIESELSLNQQKVLDVEGRIKDLKISSSSYDLDKERSLLVDKYLSAKTKYENLLHVDPNEVASTSQGLYAEDPNFVSLMKGLTDASLERIELLASHGPQNKRVKVKNAQIERFKSAIRKEHLHTLDAWKKTVQRYKARLEATEMVYQSMNKLQREYMAAVDSYQTVQQKYNEAVIAGAMDKANVASARIVAPASYTSTPAYPRKILLLIISFFFAIIGGIAAAFFAEKIYSRIVNLTEISKETGLPVLFSLPRFNQQQMSDEVGLAGMLHKKFAAINRFLASDSAEVKVHLLLSPSAGAGSSFIARRLAAYAQQTTELKTLLLKVVLDSKVDPVISSTSNSKGVAVDYLEISEKGLDDVSFAAVIDDLKSKNYNNIFIDLPNGQDDFTYLSILQSVDVAYLNVAYDISDKFALNRMVAVMNEQFELKPVGAFFNLRHNEIPDALYKRL